MDIIKIVKTEKYFYLHEDSTTGERIVCKGKLVLLRSDIVECTIQIPNEFSAFEYYKPLIISETEEIKGFDYYLGNEIERCESKEELDDLTENCKKILALPEDFSPEILKDIVDGKLKDGDEVFVECVNMNGYLLEKDYRIKLNKDNYIKLFLVNKEESWDKIKREYDDYRKENSANRETSGSFIDFLKYNYNSPIKLNQ